MKVSIEMTAEEAQKGLVVRVCCDGQDVTQLGFPKKNEGDVIYGLEEDLYSDPPQAEPEVQVEEESEPPAPPAPVEEPVVPESTEEDMEIRPVKGFILSKCPKCGAIKSFFARDYTTYNKCRECGCEYTLDGKKMIPIFAKCPACENTIKWRTDLTGDAIELNCKNCGSPVDLELNGKGTAYVTVEDMRR